MVRKRPDSHHNRFVLATCITIAVAILAASLLPGLLHSDPFADSASIVAANGEFSWAASGKLAGFLLLFFSIVVAILKFADHLDRS